VDSKVSLSTNEYKGIALESAEYITIEIYSRDLDVGHNLPEKKVAVVPRSYLLEHAEIRTGRFDDDVYYTINVGMFDDNPQPKINKTRYIVLEGGEGTGKTTMTKMLAGHLRDKGFSVLETKEPGTKHLPLTMALRKIMLDAQYEDQITATAREFISQSIRSIHLEKLVFPAIEENKYDFIIQDRGILSGLAYGMACGNDTDWLVGLAEAVSGRSEADGLYDVYTDTVYLTGSTSVGLKRALAAKQEFAAGDAMEARGDSFMDKVSGNFDEMSEWFDADTINVDDKSIDQVFKEVLDTLDLV
jgi:dTMP kinase